MLSKNQFDKCASFINSKAREIDKALFGYHFGKCGNELVVDSLSKFQNPDGGFGHGLEPDFRTPSSSAIATCLAIQYLEKSEVDSKSKILTDAINYLVESYRSDLKRWRPVPDDVNYYAHAPWWHLDDKTGQCAIEHSWENPTLEILGYLSKYESHFPQSEFIKLTNKAIDTLSTYNGKMEAEHDLYCYISFFNHASPDIRVQIQDKLKELITATMNTNPADWKTKYVPKPLNFIDNPSSILYNDFKTALNENLNFLIEDLGEKEAWFPVWNWDNYADEWEKAKIEWAGQITVDNLIKLKNFGRI